MASDSIPEEWRPVEGWPYEISNRGRLRRSRASGSKYAASYRTAGTYLMGSVDCYGYRKFQMVRDDGTGAFAQIVLEIEFGGRAGRRRAALEDRLGGEDARHRVASEEEERAARAAKWR